MYLDRHRPQIPQTRGQRKVTVVSSAHKTTLRGPSSHTISQALHRAEQELARSEM